MTATSMSVVSPPFQTTRQCTRSGALRWTTTLSIKHRSSAFFCSLREAIGPPPFRDLLPGFCEHPP